MRTDLVICLATASLATGHAIERRADQADQAKKWHPITTDPSFFQLKVNVNCDDDEAPTTTPDATPVPASNCVLQGYGIRLENYKVIATPYDRWYDPTVATFFVDDDTAMYTVSKDPLQMYINAQTGEFQYAKVGWLPSNAIGLHFFHTGDSPLGTVGEGKASSFLTWPSTQGIVPENGSWMFCPRGTPDARTGTYELFIDDLNFPSSGVDKATCLYANLVAADANPWRQKKPAPHHHYYYDTDDQDEDTDADADADEPYPTSYPTSYPANYPPSSPTSSPISYPIGK